MNPQPPATPPAGRAEGPSEEAMKAAEAIQDTDFPQLTMMQRRRAMTSLIGVESLPLATTQELWKQRAEGQRAECIS